MSNQLHPSHSSATEPLLILVQCIYAFNAYYALHLLERVFDGSLFVVGLLLLTAFLSIAGVMYARLWSLRITITIVSLFSLYFVIFSPIKTDHYYYFWMYLLVMLGVSSFRDLSRTFYYAQLTILSAYMLAGLWKAMSALHQCTHDIVSHCSLYGPSYLLAERSLRVLQTAPLGDWVIRNPLLSFTGYWAVMLLQCSAIFIFVYYPRARISISLLLIFFHLSVFLVMRIPYIEEILLLAFVFLVPLVYEQTRLQGMIAKRPFEPGI